MESAHLYFQPGLNLKLFSLAAHLTFSLRNLMGILCWTYISKRELPDFCCSHSDPLETWTACGQFFLFLCYSAVTFSHTIMFILVSFPLLECKPQGGRDFYVSFTDETQMYQTVWDIAGIQYLFNEWVNDWKSAFWKTHSIPNVLILWKILNIILDLFWERAVTQWRTEGAVSLSSQGWSYVFFCTWITRRNDYVYSVLWCKRVWTGPGI